jgi:hypothetical protein
MITRSDYSQKRIDTFSSGTNTYDEGGGEVRLTHTSSNASLPVGVTSLLARDNFHHNS